MPSKRNIEISWPMAGLNRRSSYKQHPPYATNDCLNVRPYGTLSGRQRGGSRPGLVLSHIDELGAEVRMLYCMTLALGDNWTCFSDTFSGTSMSVAWTAADWLDTPALPNILPSALASVDTDLSEAAAVLDTLPIDTSEAYSVDIFLTPWGGSLHGKYRIYLRLDDTTPDIETDGVTIEFEATESTNSYICSLSSIKGGVVTYTFDDVTNSTDDLVQPGWLSAVISGDSVSVYWNGVLLFDAETVDTHTGTGVGFGMECENDDGLCLVNVFRVQYFSTESVPSLRSMLIASADSGIFYESTYGRLTQSATTLSVRNDCLLNCCQDGQDLYIADYGDIVLEDDSADITDNVLTMAGVNWETEGLTDDTIVDYIVVISNGDPEEANGTYKIASVDGTDLTIDTAIASATVSYHIERAPKVYDPATDTLSIMFAESNDYSDTGGQVPTGCPLICRYCDRIVLAGHDITPNAWYMSRVGYPLDWDFSQEDSQRPMLGQASAAGVPGEPITALCPHSDDYLVIGCRTSLWRLRGDPAYGGQLDNLSHIIGIIGPKAWCDGPNGELIFLSLDGLYSLPAGGDGYPISLSREVLPQEFLNINPTVTTVLLEYDSQNRGIHIYLTPVNSNECVHWWMDWENKTFWPLTLDSDYEPTCTCFIQSTAIEDSCVILGCRDGYLRRFSNFAETDCGTVYDTYIKLGPIPLAADTFVGILQSMDAVIAVGSGDVTWETCPALTYEGTISADVSDTGVWEEGLNATEYPDCGGQAFTLGLTGEEGRKWELESINATITSAGRRGID